MRQTSTARTQTNTNTNLHNYTSTRVLTHIHMHIHTHTHTHTHDMQKFYLTTPNVYYYNQLHSQYSHKKATLYTQWHGSCHGCLIPQFTILLLTRPLSFRQMRLGVMPCVVQEHTKTKEEYNDNDDNDEDEDDDDTNSNSNSNSNINNKKISAYNPFAPLKLSSLN